MQNVHTISTEREREREKMHYFIEGEILTDKIDNEMYLILVCQLIYIFQCKRIWSERERVWGEGVRIFISLHMIPGHCTGPTSRCPWSVFSHYLIMNGYRG